MYFEDCPFYQKAEELLKEVLEETGIQVPIIKKNIVDRQTAVSEQFVGSPTIRLNGEDVDPAARTSTTYNLMCRVYWIKGGFLGWPDRELIRTAILEATAADQSTASG